MLECTNYMLIKVIPISSKSKFASEASKQHLPFEYLHFWVVFSVSRINPYLTSRLLQESGPVGIIVMEFITAKKKGLSSSLRINNAVVLEPQTYVASCLEQALNLGKEQKPAAAALGYYDMSVIIKHPFPLTSLDR